MLLRGLRDNLQNLTKRKITNEYLGNLFGTTSQNISKRINQDSKVTVEELEIVQNDLGVFIYQRIDESNKFIKNTLERQNDKTVASRVEGFGIRLTEIQDKHEYLDKDMAKLLKISEMDYIHLKCGDFPPDIEVVNKIKQYFEVSIDWLLYGD